MVRTSLPRRYFAVTICLCLLSTSLAKEPDISSDSNKDAEKLEESEKTNEAVDSKEVDKKASFNAWGGKRSDDQGAGEDSSSLTGEGSVASDVASDAASQRERRAPKFASWGGKRADGAAAALRDYIAQKRRFNSWGGKRSEVRAHVQTFSQRTNIFMSQVSAAARKLVLIKLEPRLLSLFEQPLFLSVLFEWKESRWHSLVRTDNCSAQWANNRAKFRQLCWHRPDAKTASQDLH